MINRYWSLCPKCHQGALWVERNKQPKYPKIYYCKECKIKFVKKEVKEILT